jgi:hypothetical protein
MVDEVCALNEHSVAQYNENRRRRSEWRQQQKPAVTAAPAPQPADASPAPADDGRTLWLKVSCTEDARFELMREALEACPGNQKVILYLVQSKQRLSWQKGADIQSVYDRLEPIIGKENIVIK